jgi:hypothetical protein
MISRAKLVQAIEFVFKPCIGEVAERFIEVFI